MRDRDIEQLFVRIGHEARPDAEFEEDLLLRLEARLNDEPDADEHAVPVTATGAPATVEVAFGHEQPSRQRHRPLLAVAASIIATAGLVGLLLTVGARQSDDPVTTEPAPTLPPPPSTLPPPPSVGQEMSVVCARHAERLSEIDAMGSPLSDQVPAEERRALLEQLAEMADDYLATATAIGSTIEPAIVEDLTSIRLDIDSELAFIERDRPDGAKYAVPTAADRILAVNAQLADGGVTSCG